MESRKIVLVNLFTGKECRRRRRNGLVDTARKGEHGTN